MDKEMRNALAKIGKHDSCPCGSGKEFGNCCRHKGHAYALLEYGEKRIVYNLDKSTQNIGDVLAFTYDNIVAFWNSQTVIEKEKGLELLSTLYGMVDKILEPFLRNSSCKKGCHECCYSLIQIQAIEAAMIRRYVQESFEHKQITNVLAKIDEASKYYPDPTKIGSRYPNELWNRYFNLHIPCPFLATEGHCTVYQARPLMARTHIAFSDPELCKTTKGVHKYEGYYFPQIFAAVGMLSRLVFQDIDYEKHVAHWFVGEFRF
jgi:Fe-S-cluster containining protein